MSLTERDPSTTERAEQARRALRELVRPGRAEHGSVEVRVGANPDSAAVEVPREAFELLLEVLEQLAKGNAVSVVPVHTELTTQQVADLLNVSRPHVVRLLDDRRLPSRKVGTHRRVRAEDVLAFKAREEARRREVLDELASEAQRLGLGY